MLIEADKRYHTFWWNENFYELNRILFRNRVSPYVIQKVIRIHTLRFKKIYSEA